MDAIRELCQALIDGVIPQGEPDDKGRPTKKAIGFKTSCTAEAAAKRRKFLEDVCMLDLEKYAFSSASYQMMKAVGLHSGQVPVSLSNLSVRIRSDWVAFAVQEISGGDRPKNTERRARRNPL